ncbi:hypothetical protein AB14_1888 [Escherichia coli 1-392-07_S1_C1]|nr:hypothetical protein AB14_1888 [Escherichia coli 1-392-07_S1_C1]
MRFNESNWVREKKNPINQNNKTLNNNNMKLIFLKSTLYLLYLSQNQHFVCYCICDAYLYLFIECSKTYFSNAMFFRYTPL